MMSNNMLILSRIKRLYQLQQQDLARGEIPSELDLIERLSTGISDIYRTTNTPLLNPRIAQGAPSSNDYNNMIFEIHEDISQLLHGLKNISESVSALFVSAEQDRHILQNELKTLKSNLDFTAMTLFSPKEEILFQEKFIDSEMFDQEKVKGTLATITPAESILTLQRLDSVEYREADIEIKSNGFPGNTKQVETINNIVKFVGEDNPHLDITAILDNNSDTWLEYEIYFIKEKIRQTINEESLSYKEGIPWVQETNQPLELDIILTIKEPKMVNWLSLSPFLAPNNTTEQPFIKYIIISDGKGSKKIIAENQQFGAEHVYLFDRQLCKFVTISLIQPAAYDTMAGCFYYIDSIANQNPFLQYPLLGRRIDGPQHELSLLGLNYDPATQLIVQPNTAKGYIPPDKFEKIFEPIPTQTNILSGVETVPIQRYSIGIRDIALASYKFATESTYISKPFTIQNPISLIKLSAISQTPHEPTGVAWLRYYISVDDGATWLPISADDDSTNEIKQQYIVNSKTPASLRQSQNGYIETQKDVNSVRVKIDLIRPTDAFDTEYLTPIVYGYTLSITQHIAGRAID